MSPIIWLMTVVALAAGICRYVVGAIMRIQFPSVGVIRDYNYTPSLSILLPAFNEGEAVYSTIQSISESEYPGKIEIIATDDCSADDTAEWIAKAARDFPTLVRPFYNNPNLGKTATILNALARSTSELTMVVDSDTILGPTCIRELTSCLGDPRIGAVGAPAIVRNANENGLTQLQVAIYFIGFQLYKTPENAMRTVGVIGGYSFMTRRAIFESMRAELEQRNWFGCKVLDGEDRVCTRLTLLRGFGTFMDEKAICLTRVPATFKAYWGQQLRWRRTTIRDLFHCIRMMPAYTKKLGVGSLYVLILTPVVLFISIIQIGMSFFLAPADWLDPMRIMAFFVYTFVVFVLAGMFTPQQAVKNPLKVLAFATWAIVNSLLLAPLATMTLDAGDWGANREKRKKKS